MNNQNKLLSITETAEYLAVSDSAIRTWLCRKQVFPAELTVKLGRRTLFDKEKLSSWVDAGCLTTSATTKTNIKKFINKK